MSLEYVIQNILDEASVRYKTNARSFIVDCPRCGKTDKLYIDKDEGFFVCWVCAETDGFKGGNPVRVLSILTGLREDAIRGSLYGIEAANRRLVGIDINLEEVFPSFKETKPEPLELSVDMIPIGAAAAVDGQQYLLSRGVPIQIATSDARVFFRIAEQTISRRRSNRHRATACGQ